MKQAFVILIFLISSLCAEGQTWQAVQYANGTSPHQRHENGFVEVNGKFYLVGGRGVKSVNIFDPATRIWTNSAAPPIELHHFQAVVYQSKIYVICAMTGDYPAETPVDRIYIYNPADNTWSQGATIPVNRRRGSAGVTLYNNKFYIVSGIQDGHRSGWVPWTDEYDPATGIWTALPNAPQARDHFHVGLINGKIYCAGGRRTSQPNFAANTISDVDVFDIATNMWSTPTQIPTPRGAPAIAVVNNELIVAGGEVDYQSNALATVQSYNPATNAWTTRTSLDVGRHATQFIYYTGNLYIAAGSTTMGGSGENNTMAFASYATPPANTPPIVSQPYPNQSVPNTQTSLVIQLGQIFSDNGGVNNLTFSVPSNTNAALISNSQITGSQLTFTLSGTTGTGIITLRATDASNASVQTTFQLTVTTSSPQLVNVIRINSGGPAQTFGSESWVADQYFTGGTAYSTTSPISNTTQDQIYQRERFGNFSYAIPVGQAGTYAVDFHLAEIYFGTSGQRVFNINVENGQFVRNNLDLIQTYGAKNTANILRADNLNITDGTINITFTNVVNNAKVSGIAVGRYSSSVPPANTPPVVSRAPTAQSVLSTQGSVVLQLGQIFSDDGGVNNLTFTVPNNTNPGLISNTQIAGTQLTFTLSGATGTGIITLQATDASNAFAQTTFQLTVTPSGTPQLVNVIRINSGGTAQNFGGEAWVADQYFTGGTAYSTSSPIANTTQDQIYQTERFGNFIYAIPVGQAGIYTVDFHFAEIYFGTTGQRVFNINVENGQFVRNNLDLIQTYGPNKTANVLRADNLNIVDGIINIAFTTVVNNAKVSGISVNRYLSGGGGGSNSLMEEILLVSSEETSKSDIVIYPNPANRKITVSLSSQCLGSWNFILTDAQGRQASLGLHEITAKHQSIEFDLDLFGIGHGLHHLQMRGPEKNESKKIMIK